MARRLRSLLLIAALFLGVPGSGDAAVLGLSGDNFDLSTDLTTQRRDPAPAYNAVDDEWMVIWFDTRNPGNNDVFGQRVDADGTLLGVNFPVIERADAQIDPWLAHNTTENEYLAAWRTQESGFFNRGKGRLLAADGGVLTPDFLVGNGHELSMAYNATVNQTLVTGRSPGIRGRRFEEDGTQAGSEIIITGVGAPAPNGHVALGTVQDLYLATWRDQTSENLQGQLIDSGGNLMDGPILISSDFPESGRWCSSLAYDAGSDRFLVVFGVFQELEILGQFVGGDGSLIGDNFPIATGLSERATPFVVFCQDVGCYAVFWKEGTAITGQAVNSDGSITEDPIVVSSGTVSGAPTAALNTTTGDILVVWTDTRNLVDGEEDIYAQIVTCEGSSSAPETGTSVSATPRITGVAPNPLFHRTTVSFRLPSAGQAILEIVGVDGRLVRRLGAGAGPAGNGSVIWDGTSDGGSRIPAGYYFARLRVGSSVTPGQKVIVLR